MGLPWPRLHPLVAAIHCAWESLVLHLPPPFPHPTHGWSGHPPPKLTKCSICGGGGVHWAREALEGWPLPLNLLPA